MSSDPTVLARDAAATGTAQVIPIDEARPHRRLHICLLGYRSAPFGGGQGIYLKYLSKALVEAGIRSMSFQASPIRTSTRGSS